MSTVRKPRAVLTEHEVQAQIIDALRACGLSVYSTTAYRQKGPSGVSRGVPDLLVCVDGAPGLYIGLEVKRPGKWKYTSDEQKQAHVDERFYIVTSAEGALGTVRLALGDLAKLLPMKRASGAVVMAQLFKIQLLLAKLRGGVQA